MAIRPEDSQALIVLSHLETYPGAGSESTQVTQEILAVIVMLRRLQGETYVEAARLDRMRSVPDQVGDVVSRVVASGQAGAWVAGIRDELADDPELLAELEPDLQVIEQGVVTKISFVGDSMAVSSDDSPLRGLPRDAAIAGLSRGLLGLVHAELNRALEAIPPSGRDRSGMEEAFRYECDSFGEQLREKQLAVQSTLAAGSAEVAVDQLGSLTGFIERSLTRFARAQGRARHVTHLLLADGKDAEAKRLGHLTALAGGLTREAIGSHAAGYNLALDLLDPVVLGGPLRAQAASLPFEVALPTGESTALSDAGSVDGAFIEVEGFIDRIEVRLSGDGKLIGQVDLLDPADGSRVSAIALFVQPLHVGITLSSFMRATGTFRSASTLRDGQPALEIERLSLADLSAAAWRFAFLQSAGRMRIGRSARTNSLPPMARPTKAQRN